MIFGIIGFIFLGMIELFFWSLGRVILVRFVCGLEFMRWMLLVIFVNEIVMIFIVVEVLMRLLCVVCVLNGLVGVLIVRFVFDVEFLWFECVVVGCDD